MKFTLDTDMIDGEYFDDETALALLLASDVIFANSRKYFCPVRKELQSETIVLFVNCNDTFNHAGDAEPITLNELPDLFRMFMKDKYDGVIKWVCKKRNLKPLQKIIKIMKEEGNWESWMDILEDNKL